MNEILCLGVSHKTAPLELRERLALPEGRAVGVMRELCAEQAVHEAVILSTCNRTELYLHTAEPVPAESQALTLLAREADLRPTELVPQLYSHHGQAASRHLFSVASGLDSMVLGETEIQGQVKRAYELALVEGVTGPVLNRLFRGALATGKRARTETEIGRRGISVSSVAVELAQRAYGDLAELSVLIVGTGETAELTARSLAARGARAVFVANRHYDRAIGLAQRFGGRAVRFDELPSELVRADIVLTATASPHQLVEPPELEVVMGERGTRELLLIDMAVPRDVAPDCREVPGVTVRDLDDLQALAERNARARQGETRAAEQLVEAELGRFERWLDGLSVTPTISALRDRAEAIVDHVLAENDGRWESASDADRERIGRLARSLVNRLLHEPTLRLKRSSGSDEAYVQLQAIRELFGLDVASAAESEGKATVTPLRRPGG
ncbi:MAG: glutamyl-tRNA reductase [Solirubrobacterales bacterium]